MNKQQELLDRLRALRAAQSEESEAARKAAEERFNTARRELQKDCAQVGHVFDEWRGAFSIRDDESPRFCVFCELREPAAASSTAK